MKVVRNGLFLGLCVLLWISYTQRIDAFDPPGCSQVAVGAVVFVTFSPNNGADQAYSDCESTDCQQQCVEVNGNHWNPACNERVFAEEYTPGDCTAGQTFQSGPPLWAYLSTGYCTCGCEVGHCNYSEGGY